MLLVVGAPHCFLKLSVIIRVISRSPERPWLYIRFMGPSIFDTPRKVQQTKLLALQGRLFAYKTLLWNELAANLRLNQVQKLAKDL